MPKQQGIPEATHTENNLQPGEMLCQAVSQDDLAEVQRLLPLTLM